VLIDCYRRKKMLPQLIFVRAGGIVVAVTCCAETKALNEPTAV
jgi:hypothetical protein